MTNKMTNTYMPKVRCNRCSKELFDFDEEKASVTCSFYKCKAEIQKIPHILTGGLISKQEGKFVLEFPEMQERDTFISWQDLQAELDILKSNEDKLKAEGVDLSYYTIQKPRGMFDG